MLKVSFPSCSEGSVKATQVKSAGLKISGRWSWTGGSVGLQVGRDQMEVEFI